MSYSPLHQAGVRTRRLLESTRRQRFRGELSEIRKYVHENSGTKLQKNTQKGQPHSWGELRNRWQFQWVFNKRRKEDDCSASASSAK